MEVAAAFLVGEKLDDAIDTLSPSVICETTFFGSSGEDLRYMTSISSPPRITPIPLPFGRRKSSEKIINRINIRM